MIRRALLAAFLILLLLTVLAHLVLTFIDVEALKPCRGVSGSALATILWVGLFLNLLFSENCPDDSTNRWTRWIMMWTLPLAALAIMVYWLTGDASAPGGPAVSTAHQVAPWLFTLFVLAYGVAFHVRRRHNRETN